MHNHMPKVKNDFKIVLELVPCSLYSLHTFEIFKNEILSRDNGRIQQAGRDGCLPLCVAQLLVLTLQDQEPNCVTSGINKQALGKLNQKSSV